MISAALSKEALPYVLLIQSLQKSLDNWNFSHLIAKGNVSTLI